MDSNKRGPVVLAIMDGWGVGPKDPQINAIEAADCPFFKKARENYPYTELGASGRDVGLEDGQMSGSEAGHLNIGAGRIVIQDVRKILESVGNGSFFYNPSFLSAIGHAKMHDSNIHLVGLLGNSDSPHSHPDIVLALLVLLKNHDLNGKVFLHLFTDGRDSYPNSAKQHWAKLENYMKTLNVGTLATIGGRFYGMDRAKNWDRLMTAYEVMVYGKGKKFNSFDEAIDYNYEKGNTDEYIEPCLIKKDGQDPPRISDNDSVILFNFRSDRARQFSKLFVGTNTRRETGFPQVEPPKNLSFVAMTNFGPDLSLKTAFLAEPLFETLPSVMRDFKQLYISETEKFAHVTYFINGGYADPVGGEDRIMIESPKVRSYADRPKMASEEITDVILQNITHEIYDFIVVNFPNADMVAHSGNFQATVKGIEAIDENLSRIYSALKKKNGILILTADHGNADVMTNKKSNQDFTFHTKNPVPFIVVTEKDDLKKVKLKKGILANITPTILELFGVNKPAQMDKESLIEK